MSNFADNIDFDKKIQLKRPSVYTGKKTSKRVARIKKRLIQLTYFILVVLFLIIVVLYGGRYIVFFCQGELYTHASPAEIWEGFWDVWHGRRY